MHPSIFEKELHRKFDRRVHLRRDGHDDCLVIWDQTRDGLPYPVRKLAWEHNVPHQRGTPREPYDSDLRWMDRANWSERFNGRKGAVAEIMENVCYGPERRRQEGFQKRSREVFRDEIGPYVKWRTGNRFTTSFAAGSARMGTGSLRKKDGVRRGQRKLRERGLL